MPCGLRGSRPDLVHVGAEPFGNVLRRVTGVVVEPGEHDHVEVGELGAAHVPMTPHRDAPQGDGDAVEEGLIAMNPVLRIRGGRRRRAGARVRAQSDPLTAVEIA